jgi:hypothetical protein
MLAHNLKAILTLVPEARSMVKQASLEEEFPYDSKDSVCASYLRMHYLEKVAEKTVDSAVSAKITKAAELHGVKAELDQYLDRFNTFEKKASETEAKYGMSRKEVEAGFEGELGGFGFLGIEKIASTAASIYEKYGDEVESLEVRRYAGRAWLNKEAAVMSLANRYHATKEPAFVKVARVVADSIKENDFDAISSLCKTVTELDKQAGLDIIGFNFYREALITKQAAFAGSMTVNLAGQPVAWEKIVKFGKERISSSLGKDIGDALNGEPSNDKAVLESLPLDLQKMLLSLTKGI